MNAAVGICDLVCKGEIQAGFALIRPPGHHAERASAGGFCFFNNVAVAAQHSISAPGLSRVMIVGTVGRATVCVVDVLTCLRVVDLLLLISY